MVEHLNIAAVRTGNEVMGTLPSHQPAEVCARGARYLHLIFDTPLDSRGQELTYKEMERCGARLQEYRVEGVPELR